MCLLSENDHQGLTTDTSLLFSSMDGTREPTKVPGFRLGMQFLMTRRDASGAPRPFPPGVISQQSSNGTTPPLAPVNGTPIATQMKKMQPMPAAGQHLRISSNGGMRPPGVPAVASMQNHTSPSRASPPHPPPQQHSPTPPNGNNAQINMPHLGASNPEAGVHGLSMPNGIVPSHQPQDPTNLLQPPENGAIRANSPARPKSVNQHVNGTNGYQMPNMNGSMNGYLPSGLPNGASYLPQSSSSLSVHQKQLIQAAFAGSQPNQVQDMQAAMQQPNGPRNPQMPGGGYMLPNGATFNMALGSGTNINLKLPPARQMNWASPMRPNSAMNGMDSAAMNGAMNGAMNAGMNGSSLNGAVNGGMNGAMNGSMNGGMNGSMNGPMNGAMNGSMSPSPNHRHAVPVPARTPSANGSRNGMRAMNGQLNSHSMSPHMQHSPSPMPSQSPPRPPMTPMQMGSPSPSMQHQQPVGGFQNVY